MCNMKKSIHDNENEHIDINKKNSIFSFCLESSIDVAKPEQTNKMLIQQFV